MILAHRIALDPTVKQRIFFAKACGCSRFAWNWALAEDRDLNAAKNINTAGLAEIKACGLKGSGGVDNATKPCQDEAGTKTLVETLAS